MPTWKDYVQEVKDKGFENASPLARLIWSCDTGNGVDQHASEDLKEIMYLLAAKESADALLKEAVEVLENDILCNDDQHDWLWKVRYYFEDTDIPYHPYPEDMKGNNILDAQCQTTKKGINQWTQETEDLSK